jgi:quercetin dioxygenase-like cupin family protein
MGDGSAAGQASKLQALRKGASMKIGDTSVTLRTTSEETGGVYTLVESTAPPYFPGLQLHLHKQTTETIYILQGMLAFTLNDETTIVHKSNHVLIPPGTVHRFWNPTAAPATYLTFFSPAGAEQYLALLCTLVGTNPLEIPTGERTARVAGEEYDHFQLRGA